MTVDRLALESAPESGAQRALRTIAGFEAFKGMLAVAAALGLLGLLHQDLHALAVSLMGHIGLNPGDRYPSTVLRDVDQLQNTGMRGLVLAADGYAVVRFTEAYGLWKDRVWGEWLGAVSGALYVPFELRHVIHSPSALGVGVVVIDVMVIEFFVWQLLHRRHKQPASRPIGLSIR